MCYHDTTVINLLMGEDLDICWVDHQASHKSIRSSPSYGYNLWLNLSFSWVPYLFEQSFSYSEPILLVCWACCVGTRIWFCALLCMPMHTPMHQLLNLSFCNWLMVIGTSTWSSTMHFSFILCTNRLITWCRRIRTNPPPPKKTCFLDLLDILKEKKKRHLQGFINRNGQRTKTR